MGRLLCGDASSGEDSSKGVPAAPANSMPRPPLSGGIEPDIMDGGHSPGGSSLIRSGECALPAPQTHDVALTDSGLARTAQSKLARESSMVAGGKDKNFCSRCIRFNFDNTLPALSFYRDGSGEAQAKARARYQARMLKE